MGRILSKKFFASDTLLVAKDMLGKFLVRRIGRKVIRAIITEVEAYKGFEDKASHAHRGKTKRNEVMFGPPGYWYVYLTYGMHWMLNIVTEKTHYPAAILIRGVATDADQSGSKNGLIQIINGPGRVTKFFKIDGRLNKKPANRASGLWIEDGPTRRNFSEGGGVRIKQSEIKKSPRIGVDYAGPVWGKKHYRFYINL